MAGEEGRSRRLGDVGAQRTFAVALGRCTREPHVLLMLYAENGSRRVAPADRYRASATALPCSIRLSDQRHGRQGAVRLHRRRQPAAHGLVGRTPARHDADLDYGNLLTAGEFLLGYATSTAFTPTGRCSIRRSRRAVAADRRGRSGAARSGPQRQLSGVSRTCPGRQGILALHRGAGRRRGGADRTGARRWWGGRCRAMRLVPAGAQPIRGVGPDADWISRATSSPTMRTSDGLRCPFGAHVRRANPRTGDMPGGRQGLMARLLRMLGLGHQDLSEDLIAASRFHRIMRRGREFGDADHACRRRCSPMRPIRESGLHFICLNANIGRQFEFIQNAWLMSAKFDGMSGETDPLLGNRAELPAGHADRRLHHAAAERHHAGGSMDCRFHHGARRRVFLPARRACTALSAAALR